MCNAGMLPLVWCRNLDTAVCPTCRPDRCTARTRARVHVGWPPTRHLPPLQCGSSGQHCWPAIVTQLADFLPAHQAHVSFYSWDLATWGWPRPAGPLPPCFVVFVCMLLLPKHTVASAAGTLQPGAGPGMQLCSLPNCLLLAERHQRSAVSGRLAKIVQADQANGSFCSSVLQPGAGSGMQAPPCLILAGFMMSLLCYQ